MWHIPSLVEIVLSTLGATLALRYGGTTMNKAVMAGAGAFAAEVASALIVWKGSPMDKDKNRLWHTTWTYPFIAAVAVLLNESIGYGMSDTMAIFMAELLYYILTN